MCVCFVLSYWNQCSFEPFVCLYLPFFIAITLSDCMVLFVLWRLTALTTLSLTPSFCPPPQWLHDVSLGQRFMFCSICEEAQNLATLLQCLLQLSGVDGPSDVPKIDLCAWTLEQLSVLKKNWILWWLSETVPLWAQSFASHSCILSNFQSGCHVALNK